MAPRRACLALNVQRRCNRPTQRPVTGCVLTRRAPDPMESIQAQRERLSCVMVAAASGGGAPAPVAAADATAASATSATTATAGSGAANAANAQRAERLPDSGGDANETRLLQRLRLAKTKNAVDRSPLLASSATDIARAGEFDRWNKILARRCGLLARVGLFRRLNTVQLRAVAARSTEQCVGPGVVIIHQYETADRSCHVILRGTAIVEAWPTEAAHKAGGMPKLLATLDKPGTLLGEVRARSKPCGDVETRLRQFGCPPCISEARADHRPGRYGDGARE